MRVDDFKSINRMLRDLSGKNKKGKVYVDNLHSPYIRFEEKYILPPSSALDPEPNHINDFVSTLAKFLPDAIEGTCILPEPRPRRETGKLFFVRPMLFGHHQFMYVFSCDMLYLGGAEKSEIKKPSAQNINPAIMTDRIYFQIKIVQLQSVNEVGEDILDFEAKRFKGGEFRVETEGGYDKPARKFSEIFDEIDFSETEAKIREELRITNDIWKLGRVYSPIGIDYLSLSMRFLQPSLADTVHKFHDFYPLLTEGDTGIPEGNLKLYQEYLAAFQVERTQSKSGNMLWKIDYDNKTK